MRLHICKEPVALVLSIRPDVEHIKGFPGRRDLGVIHSQGVLNVREVVSKMTKVDDGIDAVSISARPGQCLILSAVPDDPCPWTGKDVS